MKTWQNLSFALVMLCSGAAYSQTTNLDLQRAVVVKLQVHFPKYGDETAAGLFVGKDEKSAYFITARHALIYDRIGHPDLPQDAPTDKAQSVKLWFRGKLSVNADIFPNVSGNLDLGVVFVPLDALPANLPQIVKKDVTVNTPVHIVGHPDAGDWSVWEGTVVNENPEGDIHHFRTSVNPSLAVGYSGGPEFDANGNFLGMQISTETTYGIASKGGEIVAQLKAWLVPTDNLSDESDADAIKKVIDLYAAAFNHLDANALWKIFPTAENSYKRKIENSFANAVSIERKLSMQDPEIAKDGVNASVRGRFSEVYVPRQGKQPPRRDDDITFVLGKSSGGWTINKIR